MEREEQFNQAIENWKVHCDEVKFSSDIMVYLNCSSYEQLVELGEDIFQEPKFTRDSNHRP